MHTRAGSLVAPLLVAALTCACEAEIDRAAQHQHELIDHEYDRQSQIVEQAFVLWNATIDHQADRQTELFDHMLDAQLTLFDRVLSYEPDGFGPSTCRFESEPSGAEVFTENLFDEWEYVGETPLVVERPLAHAQRIEVRAPGYAPAHGYMLSDAVHGPCVERFVLERR